MEYSPINPQKTPSRRNSAGQPTQERRASASPRNSAGQPTAASSTANEVRASSPKSQVSSRRNSAGQPTIGSSPAVVKERKNSSSPNPSTRRNSAGQPTGSSPAVVQERKISSSRRNSAGQPTFSSPPPTVEVLEYDGNSRPRAASQKNGSPGTSHVLQCTYVLTDKILLHHEKRNSRSRSGSQSKRRSSSGAEHPVPPTNGIHTYDYLSNMHSQSAPLLVSLLLY